MAEGVSHYEFRMEGIRENANNLISRESLLIAGMCNEYFV
jgi:hypothetical protein